MSRGSGSAGGGAPGGRTDASGTPYPVDLSADRAARRSIVLFLAGPVIWIAHFMLVYVVAEAGCTGGGHGLEAFDPPIPAVVTLAATAVAAIAAIVAAAWGYRRWRAGTDTPGEDDEARDDHMHGSLAFGGLLLSALSFVTIVGVGVMAVFFGGC